jgi:hypothetical protein
MKQTKKPAYDMYPSLLTETLKAVSKFHKGLAPHLALGQWLYEHNSKFNTLATRICIEDHFWSRNGRHVIFPESTDVIDNLMRARYEIESPEGFSLPFTSFVVAMPSGYTRNGFKMPGFMASFSRDDLPEIKAMPFIDYIKMPLHTLDFSSVPDSVKSLVVQYKNPSDGAHAMVSIREKDLPRILKCRNLDEYKLEMDGGWPMVGVSTVETNSADAEIQFFALKLVASMGIYCLATGGKRLLDGFPGSVMPRLMGHDGSGGMRLSTLQSVATAAAKASPDAHYRSWHFRQLRDARFYKGEHANTPPGSRYVFVSDAMIGQKVEPSTIV